MAKKDIEIKSIKIVNSDRCEVKFELTPEKLAFALQNFDSFDDFIEAEIKIRQRRQTSRITK